MGATKSEAKTDKMTTHGTKEEGKSKKEENVECQNAKIRLIDLTTR